MESLSVVLKRRRKELGLTLMQIAEQMGVAEATVQRWESGNIKSVRYDKIDKLAEVLKVSPAVLMGWEDCQADNFAEDLNGMPEKESPSTDESALGDERISLEESTRLLVELGFIKDGQDLSDDDLTFFRHIIGLLDAWFGEDS